MAWDRTKPASGTEGVSAEIRANWLSIEQSLYGNLVLDPTFMLWPGGDSVEPAHWTFDDGGGTPGTVARETSAGNIAVPPFSAKLSFGTNPSKLGQAILDAGVFPDWLQGKVFVAGCNVKTSNINQARLQLDDGVDTTESSYHSGGGAFEWLYLVHTLNAAATKLDFNLRCEASGDCYFSGATVMKGEIAPQDFVAPHVRRGNLVYPVVGTVTTGQVIARTFDPRRPFIVTSTRLVAGTAPTGAALIVSPKHWDGSTFQAIYSTIPQLAIGATDHESAPDGTYRYRCFSPSGPSSLVADARIVADITQVGSTEPGKNLNVYIRTLQFDTPFELFRAWDDSK